MQPGRSKDVVAALALAGALGLGGFLLLRTRGVLDSSWTDGGRTFPSETGAAVRHAVWDAPAGFRQLGEAADPTLAPDGRWLVFTSGERGLNSELFLAELVDGVPVEPRPLDALNSPADEFAPAFGHGALYFASDRAGGAGGLDLWRAPYSAGEFGAVERLGAGLNSAADETDPAPLPGTQTLVFASDRARRDFDLYCATPDDTGFFACVPLDALNSPAEEREPTFSGDARFSGDPRSLAFASDRAGDAQGFDLYRALRSGDSGAADGWGTPALLDELSTPRSERGPWLAANGFELWFAQTDEDGASQLWHARSRELFPVPPPAITLAQWLTLAALLLLALLALLAKRWHALDILYKCLLVSLLLHLLLMLYLNTVVPAEKSYETGTRPGDGPSFRVRLAPPESSGAGEGLTGPAGPERQPFAAEQGRAEAPALLALAVPERAADAAPAPVDELSPEASAAPSPTLAQPAELERLAASAPALVLAPRPAGPRAPAANTPADPARAQPGAAALGVAEPGAAQVPALAAADGELARGVEHAAELARVQSESPAPVLAAPGETLARAAGTAPALALDARAAAPREESGGSSPAQARFAADARAANLAAAGPARSSGELVADLGADDGQAEAAPGHAPLAQAGATDGTLPDPALRAPAAGVGPGPAPAKPAFDATAGLAASAPRSDANVPGAPARAASRGAPALGARPAPANERPTQAFAVASEVPAAPSFEPSSVAPGTGTVTSASVAPELRAPASNVRPAPAPAAPAFDATAGLLAANAARSDAGAPTSPAREASHGAPALGARPAPANEFSAQGLALASEEPTAPAFEPSAVAPGTGTATSTASAPELRAPVPERGTAPGAPSAGFDAIAGLGGASAPTRTTPAAPERAGVSAPRAAAPAQPQPSALALAMPAAGAPEELPDRAQPSRLAETPYQNRFGTQKLRALEDFGGTPETEHAVAAGLAYLARIQGENGAWGQRGDAHQKYLDVRIGKSALALLAFLGAGHVPGGSSAHAENAERTVRYLLAEQDGATGHFGRSCSYGHGIATYALAECYALTQDARLRVPLERAVAEILRHQNEVRDPRLFGGWGYYFADGHVWSNDEWPRTSVTAWQVMALESARLGGLEVPDAAFDGAQEFLLNTWDPGARAFRYDHDPERLSSGYPILPASTPAALFALSLLGVDPRASELAPARRFVLTRAPDGYRYTGDDDFVQHARGNLYFWYYATLALFRVGGAEWQRWNEALQATLLPAQDGDGSWRPIDTYSEYAGDDDDERTYSTAMCVLSLEIYYRYFTPLLKVR